MSASQTAYFRNQIQRTAFLIFAILLGVDLIMVGLHVINSVVLPEKTGFLALDKERSISEYFQYFKEVAVAVGLFYLAFSKKMFGLLAWSLLFLYFFLDDAFRIHENGGRYLAETLNIQTTHVRPKDVGELLISVAAGSVAVLSFLVCYVKTKTKEFRSITHDMFFLFCLLGFFGVAVDLIHMAFENSWFFTHSLTMLEDGGELFVMSMFVAYVYQLSSDNDELWCLVNATLNKAIGYFHRKPTA